MPGVSAGRTIVAPPVTSPSAVVLAKAQPQPSGCMLTSQRWVCSPSLETATEEQYGFDHSFHENAAERSRLTGSAILIASSLVDKYARLDLREATASLIAFEAALEDGTAADARDRQRIVAGYNEDDCRATLALRDWLEERRA